MLRTDRPQRDGAEVAAHGKPRRGARLQSVERAFALVEAIANEGGLATLTQLTRSSRLPGATVHRLINALVDLGYVSHAPDHRYRLGPKFARLGEAAIASGLQAVGPLLRELADRVGETTALLALEQDSVVPVAYAESTQAIRVIMDPGMRPPPHSTASGKVLLAQLDDSQIRALLDRTGLPALTPNTVTSADGLIAGLHEVRADGYAMDVDELEVGLSCMAVPVRGPRPYALALAGPDSRVTVDRRGEFIPLLTEIAKEMSAVLDGRLPIIEPTSW